MSDLAGYRVVRSLSRGPGRELLLGFGGDDTVVLVRFDLQCEPAVWAGELEALSRAAGEHVVRVIDVGSDDGVVCLILERLTGGSLAQLLRDRTGFEAGELVTLLAPLAATMERCHTAGVAHGAFRPSAVIFTADGSPTLVGFAHAERFTPGSPEVVRETVAAVSADREGLRRLAVDLLGRVRAPNTEAARELAAVFEALPAAQLCRAVEEQLHGLAPATAVQFGAEVPESDAALAGMRVIPVAEVDPEDPATLPPLPAARSHRMIAALEEWLAPVLELDPVVRVREVALARWSALTPRARRLSLGVAAGAVVVVVALGVVPPAPPAPHEATSPTAPTTSEQATSAAESEAEPSSRPSVDDGDLTASGDDPVAASRALVAARARCLQLASLLCLDDVTQPGSAAAAADRALVRAIQAGGEAPEPIVADDPVLIERLGDSALIALSSEPTAASLLLMKGEAGWRIRDYLPGV